MFERKTLSMLQAEMQDEKRLHRILGPVTLTSLGVGAIIGAGIFALTGRVAAEDAGPAVVLSFAIAGLACMFAALCYSEFAAMAPVAGSAYTYTYATLGEVWAWIIGWDLILEYAMGCSVVASHWTKYLNEALLSLSGNRISIPAVLSSDPFTKVHLNDELIQPYCNLPAMLLIGLITYVLVRGIRESAIANTFFVIVKLTIVLFVIGLGANYVTPVNWTGLPPESRRDANLPDYLDRHPEIAATLAPGEITSYTTGKDLLGMHPELRDSIPVSEQAVIEKLPNEAKKWGLLSILGVKDLLDPVDDAVRNSFMPYGLSGLMIGAALVFFSYIGFDSISTHAEEARHPQRDIPIAILASLGICTLLYMLVAGVITGMEPYWSIDPGAALAAAFRKRAEIENNPLLQYSSAAIAVGAVTGLTSVILVLFLSQSRIFLAMARDGLLPNALFGAVHEKYRTPHRSTILTGIVIAVVSGFCPIRLLEEMVSIGTLMAFVLVCASVMILRIRHPEVPRPFRCPALFIVAPLGMLVNILLLLFLPIDTWIRLIVWLALGMLLYFCYGMHHSRLRTIGNPQSAKA